MRESVMTRPACRHSRDRPTCIPTRTLLVFERSGANERNCDDALLIILGFVPLKSQHYCAALCPNEI
jgi:hypothetical protein